MDSKRAALFSVVARRATSTSHADSGLNWAVVPSLADPQAGTSVLTTPNGSLFAGLHKGNYRSTDGGMTWVHIAQMPLAADQAGRLYAAGAKDCLWLSADNGDHWTMNAPSFGVGYVTAFAALPSGRVLMRTSTGMYRSADGGITWLPSGNGMAVGATGRLLVYNNTVYLVGFGDTGVYVTTDDGDTWAKRSTTLPWSVYTDAVVDPAGRLFASVVNYGLYRSTDQAETWTDITGSLDPNDLYSLGAGPDGVLLLGTLKSGVYRSTDAGHYWTTSRIRPLWRQGRPSIRRFAEQGLCQWLAHVRPRRDMDISGRGLRRASADGVLFAASSENSASVVYRSEDDGATWQPASNGLPLSSHGVIESLVPVSGGTVIANLRLPPGPGQETYALYRTGDNGDSWTSVFASGPTVMIYGPVVSGTGQMTVFAGVLYRSLDDGVTWSELPPSALNGSVTAHGSNVGLSGRLFLCTSGGYYASSDDGEHWTWTSTSHPPTASNADGDLFGFDPHGVWRSGDGGNTWGNISAEVTPTGWDLLDSALAVDQDGYLYTGTQSLGVWRTTNPTVR